VHSTPSPLSPSKDGFLLPSRRRFAVAARGASGATPGRIAARRIRAASVCAIAALAACGPGSARDRATGSTSSASAVASGAGSGRGPVDVTDDVGTVVHLRAPATRIVSLIPSATETLIAIGAADAIVGRTRYDTATAIAHAPSVGGGVDPSVEAIVALKPDLVVAWASDGRGGLRERLAAAGIETFVMRTEDTTDIFRNIGDLGRLTGRASAAGSVASSMRAALDSVRASVAGRPAPSVVYVVFPDPPMTAGPNTFIGQLLALAGGRSIFPTTDANWPTVPMEEIVKRDPDIVIVPVADLRDDALERFRKLAGWRSLCAVREGRVVSVSGDLLSRPSPAIARSAFVLRDAVHPELAARDSGRVK
jgi:iron complex transport system substrate-binding protein